MIGEVIMHKGELEDIAVTSVPKGHHEDLHLIAVTGVVRPIREM